jgi:hypothetical protein
LRSGDWIAKPFQGVPSLNDVAYDTSLWNCARLKISRPEKQVVKVLIVAACPAAKRSIANAESSIPAPVRIQARPGQAEAPTPTQSTTPSQQMSMGVLAVVSDHEVALFIDGEQKTVLVPDKIVTLNLTAGQHFVDLRDAKGSKLWEKMVAVPAGVQIAEKIELDSGVRAGPQSAAVVVPPANTGPPAKRDVTGSQQSPAFVSSGPWSCVEPAPCAWIVSVSGVSVSGSVFSARLEMHPELKGQSCNQATLPVDQGLCYYVEDYSGTIDGSTIEGVVLIKANHSDVPGCDHPYETQRFTATIKENGQVISIYTESNSYSYPLRNTSTWRGQKPKIVCDGVKVDHTEPANFVLHSMGSNGVSIPAMPTPTNPAAYAPNSYIETQIDEVARSGRYSALPPAQATGGTVGQQPGLSIGNQQLMNSRY